jgi:16S rRNA (cytosine967-C5)-methyltransferase
MKKTGDEISAERLAAWERLCRPRRATTVDSDPGEAPADRRRQAQADRLVRGVLRNLSLLDALIDGESLFRPDRTPKALRWVLRLAAFEKIFQDAAPDYAIGEQAVALARGSARAPAARTRAAGFVNAIVRRLLETLPASPEALAADPRVTAMPPHLRWSVPQPILDRLAEGYGAENFSEVLPTLASGEAPVWLRVNTLRGAPEEIRRELQSEGVVLDAPPPLPGALPEALLWTGGDRLPWQTAAWERGAVTVQDLAAMLATDLLDPRPGETVLDACAAPGGKTGHLWQRMQGRGRLAALEVDPARRRRMADALTRLFGPDHTIEMPPAADLRALPGDRQFDRVLLDAPCLALGLIGRHPEIRWDDRLRNSRRVGVIQRELLETGAARVAPGGRLLWATCSPTRIENEEIIGPWLCSHPEWRLIGDPLPSDSAWNALIDKRAGWVRTRPDRIPCDGFAMALMQRKSASAF